MSVSKSQLERVGVAPQAADAVAREATTLKAKAGQALFHPGADCAGYVLPLAGVIRVSMTAASGRELTLYRVAPGELCLQTFQCLATGAQYSADGVAESDLEAAFLPRACFDRLLGDCAAFRSFVMACVADRFAQMAQIVEVTAFHPIDQRLAAALVKLAEQGVVRQTHAEIAAEIGSVREVVSRRLAQLEREGAVSVARGQVQLLDLERLTDLAGALL